jgi:hypothetical protein
MTPEKTIDGSRIRRDSEKAPLFDPRKEKNTFEEARRGFVGGQTSSSREQPELKECEIPPAFHQSVPHRKGKEVSKLMEFLYTCITLIKYERDVKELQHLIRQY